MTRAMPPCRSHDPCESPLRICLFRLGGAGCARCPQTQGRRIFGSLVTVMREAGSVVRSSDGLRGAAPDASSRSKTTIIESQSLRQPFLAARFEVRSAVLQSSPSKQAVAHLHPNSSLQVHACLDLATP